MTHVVVTGGSGKLGRACVRELTEHGYDVTNVDLVPSRDDRCPHVRADLADFGQTLEVLAGVDEHPAADAVVHLAAIPAPGLVPNAEVFRGANARAEIEGLRPPPAMTTQTLIALVRGLDSQHPLVGGAKREHAHRRRPRGGFRLEGDFQES